MYIHVSLINIPLLEVIFQNRFKDKSNKILTLGSLGYGISVVSRSWVTATPTQVSVTQERQSEEIASSTQILTTSPSHPKLIPTTGCVAIAEYLVLQ